MVSPLPAAPRTHLTGRNNESYNVLEGHAYLNPVSNKVMQSMPSQSELPSGSESSSLNIE
jgi:hypothetical protein